MRTCNPFSAIILTIMVLMGVFCDESTNPTGGINKDDLIGRWMLTKEIEVEIEEVFEGGVYDKDVWADSAYVTDTSRIVEITVNDFIFYNYDEFDSYYTKMVVPYTLSGNAITGNEFFNGYEDEGGGSYELWATTVKSLTTDECIIEYTEECKEVDGADWELENETVTEYFDRYSGSFPPATWPDSVEIITVDGHL